jgi:RNA polymerase sigma factor (TIGR02999 family)
VTKPDETVNSLLRGSALDEGTVVDQLVPVVYDELRRMARRFLAGESERLTLDTTALVHEAYLKLVGGQDLPARGRSYFFGAAARAMRQLLVDAARRRGRHRRGGGERPLPISVADPAAREVPADVLEVDEALGRLAAIYPRQAQVVECRFFGGLSVDETAAVLSISPRTVKRDWLLAQAWLFRELRGAAG